MGNAPKRIGIFAAVAILFSGFDAFLFPKARDGGWIPLYRIMQITVQLALYAGAFFLGDLATVAACTLFWWTGGTDLMFYWWLGLNVASGEAWGYGELWWTPVGLYRCATVGKANVRFRAWEVYTQAALGAAASILIAVLA